MHRGALTPIYSSQAIAIVAAEMGHSIEVLFKRYLGSTANDVFGGLMEIEDQPRIK